VVCYEAQLAIAASIRGNLGKRPAAACRLIGDCSMERLSAANCTIPILVAEGSEEPTSVPVKELDYCTVTGFVNGGRVDGNAAPEAPLQTDRCFTSEDCDSAEKKCASATDGATVCVCSDGMDTCKPLGQCALTDCGKCNSCMEKAGAFVEANKASNVSSLVTAFVNECKSWGKVESMCSSVASAITNSFEGYMGRRAGMLCSQLQVCSKTCRIMSCSRLPFTSVCAALIQVVSCN
jgi:hypothetical protein